MNWIFKLLKRLLDWWQKQQGRSKPDDSFLYQRTGPRSGRATVQGAVPLEWWFRDCTQYGDGLVYQVGHERSLTWEEWLRYRCQNPHALTATITDEEIGPLGGK